VDRTHEVAKKLPNELNLYDMSGNVAEWVWDKRDVHFQGGTVIDYAGTSSTTFHRYTQGSAYSYGTSYLQVLSWQLTPPAFDRLKYVGFRIARSAE
jgi:formylglycine-generating enzyme required for sulfatase activity